MALNNPTPVTIAQIEEQIAKVNAELEKARVAQFTAIEKVFLAAQKRRETAQVKVNDLVAKAGTTAAAQTRLALARAALAEQEVLFEEVAAQFNVIKAEQDAADTFSKNVALVLSGKKLGKKIKFTKKEKAVIKEDKKAAKKLARQEKKAAKQRAKDEKKQSAEISTEQSENEITPAIKTTAKAAPKIAAKKVVAKKPAVKRPPAKKAIPVKPDTAPSEAIETPLPEIIPSEIQQELPATTSTETPAVETGVDDARETGKDVVIETETLPPSEIATPEKP